MSDPNTEQEPTMEEILASIRRIISEDGEEETEGQEADAAPEAEMDPVVEEAAEEPEVEEMAETEPEIEMEAEPEPEEDILELTDEIEEDIDLNVEAVEIEPEVEPEPEIELETEPEPEFEMAASTKSMPGSLLADPTIAATTSAFANLAGAVASSRGLQMGNNATLEDMVKDMLRPILKDWLDQNLPQIVQRIVEREVSKLADRADNDE